MPSCATFIVFSQPCWSTSAARCNSVAARGPACAIARLLSAGSPGCSTQPQAQAVAYSSPAGRPAGELYATAWACGCVLQPGEPADSKRAMAHAGPRAATLLHRAADVDQQGWENTMNVAHEGIADAVAGYVEMARRFEPSDARYLQ